MKRTLKNYSLSYCSHLLDQFYLCLAVALSPFLTIITGAVGAVAQLGERVVRIDEVAGSNPVSSTILRKTYNFLVIGYFFIYRLRSLYAAEINWRTFTPSEIVEKPKSAFVLRCIPHESTKS